MCVYYVYMYIHTYIYMHITTMRKEDMILKKIKEESMGGFGGRKSNGENMQLYIILKN